MDQILQKCRALVSLPKALDPDEHYLQLCQEWAETRLPTIEVWYKKDIFYSTMVTGPDVKEVGDLVCMSTTGSISLWLVLAAHVSLDYSTDAREIKNALISSFQIESITGLTKAMVKEVLCWSVRHLYLKDLVQKGKITRRSNGRVEAMRITEAWRRVFEHLHNQEPFALPEDSVGVVYFALFELSDGYFTVLFVDGITGAVEFSTPFQFEMEGLAVVSRNCRKAIDDFMQKYGQPVFMVCFNLWKKDTKRFNRVATVFQNAIQGLLPVATTFCIYNNVVQKLPAILAASLDQITNRLEQVKPVLYQGSEPLVDDYAKHSSLPWQLIFVLSFGDLLQRKFCLHQSSSYFLGPFKVTNTKLRYVRPRGGNLQTIDDWRRLDVTSVLDKEAIGDMKHHRITKMTQESQLQLENMVALSCNYFLHNVSPKSRGASTRFREGLFISQAKTKRSIEEVADGADSPVVRKKAVKTPEKMTVVEQAIKKARGESRSPVENAIQKARMAAKTPTKTSAKTKSPDTKLPVTTESDPLPVRPGLPPIIQPVSKVVKTPVTKTLKTSKTSVKKSASRSTDAVTSSKPRETGMRTKATPHKSTPTKSTKSTDKLRKPKRFDKYGTPVKRSTCTKTAEPRVKSEPSEPDVGEWPAEVTGSGSSKSPKKIKREESPITFRTLETDDIPQRSGQKKMKKPISRLFN